MNTHTNPIDLDAEPWADLKRRFAVRRALDPEPHRYIGLGSFTVDAAHPLQFTKPVMGISAPAMHIALDVELVSMEVAIDFLEAAIRHIKGHWVDLYEQTIHAEDHI